MSDLPQTSTDERRYEHSDLTELVIRVFYEVYRELGHGFLENVYEQAMAVALKTKGLEVQQQVPVPVWFRGVKIGAYEADLVVSGILLLELKACRTLDSSHEAQLLNYLRSTELEIGLLMNFGPRPQLRRFVFQNYRKQISVHQRSSVAKGAS